MKLSTFNKIEAVAKTMTTLTAIGGAHALQTSIKKKQDDMTRKLNADIGLATKESIVGQKIDDMTQRTQDRYAALRDRVTAPKAEAVQPAVSATEE